MGGLSPFSQHFCTRPGAMESGAAGCLTGPSGAECIVCGFFDRRRFLHRQRIPRLLREAWPETRASTRGLQGIGQWHGRSAMTSTRRHDRARHWTGVRLTDLCREDLKEFFFCACWCVSACDKCQVCGASRHGKKKQSTSLARSALSSGPGRVAET